MFGYETDSLAHSVSLQANKAEPIGGVVMVDGSTRSIRGVNVVTDFIERGAVTVIEVIGITDKGFEDAVSQAVAKASESISGITGVEVTKMNARVVDGRVAQYRAACKLAFVVK